MKGGEAASTGKRILDRKSEFKTGKLDLPGPLAQPPKCPECTSQRVWKDGLRKTSRGDVQRYLCRSCGYRFSQTEPKNCSEPLKKPSSWSINNASTYNLDRQVCEILTEDSKNLAKVQSRTEKQAAGATKPDKATVKGKIVEYALKLKREGYRESTIQRYMHGLLTLLNRKANLFDPESVKEVIAQQPWKEDTKLNYVNFYDTFTKFIEIQWTRPRYQTTRKFPFIPLEQEIDQLIYATGKKTSVILHIIKETAMRIGEVLQLKWTDINPKHNLITLNLPEKGCYPGIYNVSSDLITRILMLPRKSERIFPTKRLSTTVNFLQARKRLARRFNNPRLVRITFHTIRHWKATMEYHKTKDIIHVKDNILRHKSIENTMLYIHLEKAIFDSTKNCEYHVRVAKTVDESCELVKVGFEYVTGEYSDGGKIFRKRK